MEVGLVNPLLRAIRAVFIEELETEVLFNKLDKRNLHNLNADVSTLVSLSGDAMGHLALRLPMATAVRIASRLQGVEMTRQDPGFSDVLGQLTSRIVQRACSEFGDLKVGGSLPTVFFGEHLSILDANSERALTLPCDSALGRFHTEVTMIISQTEVVDDTITSADTNE